MNKELIEFLRESCPDNLCGECSRCRAADALESQAAEIERITKQRDELLAAEHELSSAYIRLREKLGAFDTPTAPTPEQVYAHTEMRLGALIKQRDELLALVESAFREGFRSPATYNDSVINEEDSEWERSDAFAAIASVKEQME